VYVAVLAILQTGAAYVPLDPSYPQKRLDYMVSKAGLSTIVSTSLLRDTLQNTLLNYLLIDSDGRLQDTPVVHDLRTADDPAVVPDRTKGSESASIERVEDCAYVMFTSGSTGHPKAVAATHQSTINRLQWMWTRFPFTAADICCQKTALSFVDSIWEMFGPLLRGVPTVVIPQQSLSDVIEFVDILEQEQISRIVLVPTLLGLLLNTHRDLGSRLHKLSLCTVSGEALPQETASRFFSNMPDAILLNLYGSTEVAADVTYDIVTRNALSSPMPLGGPIDNTDIYILDNALNLLPAGCVGEICISGHSVAAGYLGELHTDTHPSQNQEISDNENQRFIKNPFSNEPGFERLYRTGDLGRLRDDGLLEHHGRQDSQVKLHGIRIDFAEIELALTDQPAISNAVAGINRFDQLFAAVIAADNAHIDVANVCGTLAEKLPAHMHIQPGSIQLLDLLPVLPNGKLDRKLLEAASVRQQETITARNKAVSESVYLAGTGAKAAVSPNQVSSSNAYSEISAAVSRRNDPLDNAALLTSIWCSILGQDDIDTSKNFFQLGGNSINAMQIVVECQRAGLDVNLKDIVDYGSIDNLAPAIRAQPLSRLQATDMDQHDGGTDASLAADDLEILDSHLKQHFGLSVADRGLDFFRLSEGQRGMLFETLLAGPDVPLYVSQFRSDLLGTVNSDDLQRAFEKMRGRHSALRTIILHIGLTQPIQVVLPDAHGDNKTIDSDSSSYLELDWSNIDLCELTVDQQKLEIDKLAQRTRKLPISIENAPSIRANLIKLAEQHYHLLLDFHHLVLDGWSAGILTTELLYLCSLYAKQKGNPEAIAVGETLLPEPGNFRDHVAFVNSIQTEQSKDFWYQYLADLPEHRLFDRQSSAGDEIQDKQNKQGRKSTEVAYRLSDGHQTFSLNVSTSEKLNGFARDTRVTANILVQAAWSLVLARYLRSNEVIFGITTTGRSSGIDQMQTTTGMFVNTLPLRVRIDESQTLADWFTSMQAIQFEMLEYENTPVNEIRRAANLAGDAPLFETLLVYQNLPRVTLISEPPFYIANHDFHENNAWPLSIQVIPGDEATDGLRIILMHEPSTCSDRQAGDMANSLAQILAQIANARPSTLLGEIQLFESAEVARQIDTFNNTEREYKLDKGLTHLIWSQARQTPDSVAVTFENRSLSYSQVINQADHLATLLVKKLGDRLRQPWSGTDIGTDVGTTGNSHKATPLIGVCMSRSPELLLALLGIQRAGAAYLPLDPDFPIERNRYIVADASPLAVIIDSASKAVVDETDGVLYLNFPFNNEEKLTEYGSGSTHNTKNAQTSLTDSEINDHLDKTMASPAHLAYVMYTSGSTGKPKGIRVTNRGLSNFLFAMSEQPGIDEADKVLAITTFAFDISVLELFLPLCHGASTDIVSTATLSDGYALAKRIKEQQISLMQATPSVYRLLIACDWNGQTTLRTLVGGEALATDLLEQLAPKVACVWNMYGPTETTIWSSCAKVAENSEGSTKVLPVSIGGPIANTKIVILDHQQRLCPIGVAGEIYISGEGVAEGYVDRPELDAETFVELSFSQKYRRWYRTGDLGHWHDDGTIEYLGRTDNQINLHGYRIEPAEIEHKLNQQPGIQETVITESRLAGSSQLVAWVVYDEKKRIENTSSDAALPREKAVVEGQWENDEQALIEKLRSQLPAYMVPGAIYPLDAIPKLPNGKIDRKRLATRDLQSELPGKYRQENDPQRPENQPVTSQERELLTLFERNLERAPISVNAHFLDLGGNSIVAMQVLAAIRRTGYRVSLQELFSMGTVRQVAAHMDQIESHPVVNDKAAGTDTNTKGEFAADKDSPAPASHSMSDLERIQDMLQQQNKNN